MNKPILFRSGNVFCNSLPVLKLSLVLLSVSSCLALDSGSDSHLSNGVEEERRLLDKLERSLPKYTFPLDLEKGTVNVFVDLYQLLDVDEKNGLLTAKLWLYYYYRTPSASWNVSQFSGIKSLLVPANTFWTADIVALDAIDVSYEAFTRQIVFHEGLVACWSSSVTLRLSCPFDVSHFPYDTHTCYIHFGPWTIDTTHYRIALDSEYQLDHADLWFYTEHDEWELFRPVRVYMTNRTWRGVKSFDIVTIELRLKRRDLFYSIVFVLPNFLLFIMSSFVYLVPVESGEKVSFSITILLAEIVSFEAICDFLPASSLNFPKIAYFVCSAAIQTTLSSILAILVINIHYLGGKHRMGCRTRCVISSQFMFLFGIYPCPKDRAFPGEHPLSLINKRENKNVNAYEPKNGSSNDNSSISVSNLSCVKNGLKTKRSMSGLRDRVCAKKSTNSESELERMLQKSQICKAVQDAYKLESEANMEFLWKYFALFLDRVLLYLHILVSILVLVIYCNPWNITH